MRKICIALLLAALLVPLVPARAEQAPYHCGFRELQWEDTARHRVIKVAAWYPTHEHTAAIAYGPLKGNARPDAAFAPGKHPVLMVSHGSGGVRYNQFYLSEHLAAHGYVVLAVQHPGNCWNDNADVGRLINLWNRPKDVSFALTQALREPELAAHMDAERIGVIGHSLGGYTALVLVGAKPDIGKLNAFCSSIRGWFAGRFCNPKRPELAAWEKGKFHDFTQLHDPRFRAAMAMAPGIPMLFDKAAMQSVSAPLLVFLSGKDEILDGKQQAYHRSLPPSARVVDLPDAGHFVYIMECPEEVAKRNPPICKDIGTPRTEVHSLLRKEAAAFFDARLKGAQ